MRKLDVLQPHTKVGGRNPLFYLQAGHGFARDGRYLGRFDAQGEQIGAAAEPLLDAPAPDAPVPDAPASDASNVAPDALDALPPAAPVKSPVAPVDQPPPAVIRYAGLGQKALKKLAEDRGLDVLPRSSAADLIALLEVSDK